MPARPRLVARAVLGAVPAALLAACASAANAPTDQVSITPQTVRVETPGGSTIEARTTAEDRAEARTINTKPEIAWAKLPAVYAELGLPVNSYVDATRQIASRGTRVRGRLGAVRVATLVTCGADVTGDDKANSYEVTLDVTTAIGASATASGQTDVLTMVTANGRPMSTSGEPVHCVSTGSLEKRIANGILVKSATAP